MLLTAAGLAAAVVMWAALVSRPHFTDTEAYYFAGLVDPYRVHLKTEHGAYIYSPAFTQAIEPLRAFSVDVVYALSSRACSACSRTAPDPG